MPVTLIDMTQPPPPRLDSPADTVFETSPARFPRNASEPFHAVPADDYQQALTDYQKARATVLKYWEYNYASDDDFSDAATEMYNDLSEALADPLPSADNFKDLNKSAEQIEKELESFTKTSEQSLDDHLPAHEPLRPEASDRGDQLQRRGE